MNALFRVFLLLVAGSGARASGRLAWAIHHFIFEDFGDFGEASQFQVLENGLVQVLIYALLRFDLLLLARILSGWRNATLCVALNLVGSSAYARATSFVVGASLPPLIRVLRNRFLSLHFLSNELQMIVNFKIY